MMAEASANGEDHHAQLKATLKSIVHAYDIRGVVPDQLDENIARILGRAFAALVKESDWWENQISKDPQDHQALTILCGRDMRSSGEGLSSAFMEGVLAEGIDVLDLGLASSDLLYFASGHLGLPGVIITASHNPPEYNGIKMCGPLASPIGRSSDSAADFDIDTDPEVRGAKVKEGLDRLEELALTIPDTSSSAIAKITPLDLLSDYATHALSFIDADALEPLKVVIDAGNGMAGLIVPAVLGELNVEVDLMFGDLDGSFPNHLPNPLEPKNLEDLIARVKSSGADLGLAFDGDADRVFLIDDTGEPLSGSVTTALIARYILESSPGELVGYNLICSRSVPETIQNFGGIGLKTRVGHSYIKKAMSESGAIFAGEHSGHYYFRDNFGADSGMIAALMVMELMSRAEVPLSQLKKPFEKYANLGERNFQISGDIVSSEGTLEQPSKNMSVQDLLLAFSEKYSDYPQESLDGLSVDMGSCWFNVRPSNTEPYLRINLEAESEAEAQKCWEEIKQTLQTLIA